MRHTFDRTKFKLTLVAANVKSAAVDCRALPPAPMRCSRPSVISRLRTGNCELTLQINLEAFLAGIDLDELDDTNGCAQCGRLR